MSISASLLNIAIAIGVGYAIFLFILCLIQKSIIFSSPPPNSLLYERFKDSSITLDNDGAHIQGWKIIGSNKLSDIVVIYFGGNGEDVAGTISALKKLPSSLNYAFNYRGYGLSAGSPGETELYQDALHIFSYVRKNNPDSKIAIMGYSLGSAVAGQLAAKTDASYLILLAPLFSVERIAKEKFGHLIPSWIVTNKFRLFEKVRGVKAKTLVICAGDDNIIPLSHSEETYSNLTSAKEIYYIDDVGHNDLFTVSETYGVIENFFNY